ncbi:MAG: DUF6067 family protein [Flavihumibacter sp.]
MKSFIFLFAALFFSTLLPAQQATWRDGKNAWNADSLGNHRAVVEYAGGGRYARVLLPWRRPDAHPASKKIIVVDAATNHTVSNFTVRAISALEGDIIFEPISGKGIYYIYYMPYKNEGRSNYPKGVYLAPADSTDPAWVKAIPASLPVGAKLVAFESVDAFNSFYPMEVIASEKELQSLVAKSARKDFLLFTEDRINPIRMTDHIPAKWASQAKPAFRGSAAPGEQYSFQVGLYALQPIAVTGVQCSALTNGQAQTITANRISCINTGGTDYRGEPFSKTVAIAAGKVQALWCLVDIPASQAPGIYQGRLRLQTADGPDAFVPVSIEIKGAALADGGLSEPWKQTRLHWLNSTLYQDNTVIPPYTPLTRTNNRIQLLGRDISLSANGLPEKIQTWFSPEMTGMSRQPNPVLAAPLRFIIRTNGKEQPLSGGSLRYEKESPGAISWTANSGNNNLSMTVQGSLEFDGFLNYQVAIAALNDVSIDDISLLMPLHKNAATYLMGLGQKGGYRPDHFHWQWEVATKNQDGAWIGGINAGLQFSLRDEHYSRPLNTNFYLQKPLRLPASWGNENKGSIDIQGNADTVLVRCASGARTMKKGDTLWYNFTLLITPFHTLNTDFQWANRFYHKYSPIDTIVASGATVSISTTPTPSTPGSIILSSNSRHEAIYRFGAPKGLRVKIYNTVREVSNRAYETFPLRSLGHEVYSAGDGGGFSWLQEHIREDYIAAWFVPAIKDAAIVNSGMSRWHNYYVEGMNWLVKNVGIDGIYLDDVAFDRVTMKRIKRALTANGHPGIIDLHSANQYNKSDGFNNSANLYMEHFPYLNRLWFGEYFDYEKNSPDFFLTEVSGIPFGLMGEMLEGGGNPWRGMVYGMTNRFPWDEHADPRSIWKCWDDFGMQGTSMIGYWSAACPVKTADTAILATVYQKTGKAMVALASWANEDRSVTLTIDWNKLGIDPARARITAPAIKGFQEAAVFQPGDPIPVRTGKGWLLIIE